MSRQPPERLSSPARLEALHRAGVLDPSPGSRLERLTRLATVLLDSSVSLVSLVDTDRQVFVAQTGLAEPWATRGQTPLTHSFCQHVVGDDAPLVIEDARRDHRLADNLAIRDLGVIAYLGVPLRTAEGHTLGSFCVIDDEPRRWTDDDIQVVHDLAALVQGELVLSQLEAAGGVLDATELVASVAHDLRGMVTGLVGASRTLAHHQGLEAEARDQLVGVVERQGQHLVAVLDELLEAATTGARPRVDLQAVDVGQLLDDVVTGYRLARLERLDLQVGGELHAVAAPDDLRRCVANLVDNALKHGAGAPVRVTGELVGDRVRVVVHDDGPGIPSGERDGVFALGQQGSGGAAGHGVGLHVVRTLVERMGGTIHLADGPGATFVVDLDRA